MASFNLWKKAKQKKKQHKILRDNIIWSSNFSRAAQQHTGGCIRNIIPFRGEDKAQSDKK